MTVGPGSRYQESESMWVRTRGRGNKQTIYLNTVVTITDPYSMFLMRERDTMALVAHRAYNDAERWWMVADANPQWFYPFDSFPGESLRVPS